MNPDTQDDDQMPSTRDVRAHADLDLDPGAQQRTITHVLRTVDNATAGQPAARSARRGRVTSLGRWTPALVGGVALAVVAVATLGGSPASTPQNQIKPVGEGIPEGPPSRSFALLREPSAVEMPEDVQRLLSNVGAPVSSAKSIDFGFDRPAWALSSAEKVCIVVPETLRGNFAGYGSSCTTRQRAQTSGVSDTRQHSDSPSGSDPQEVFALIPDGVSAVTVTSQGGQQREVKIERNAVRVDGQVGDRITFTDADGRPRNLGANDSPPPAG